MGRAAKWIICANGSNQKRGQMLIVRAFPPMYDPCPWPLHLYVEQQITSQKLPEQYTHFGLFSCRTMD